jgi:hypothetical protein
MLKDLCNNYILIGRIVLIKSCSDTYQLLLFTDFDWRTGIALSARNCPIPDDQVKSNEEKYAISPLFGV